jgi:excisionase family DNA binding protein
MAPDLYSVEQVAALLNLHARTVRHYVREGRLKAVRIGKQYRIARADLEALTGRSAASLEPEPVRRHRYVEVSSIVEVDAISPDEANRISIGLVGAANNPAREGPPLRIETVYNAERARLKIILMGGMETVVSFLRLTNVYLE